MIDGYVYLMSAPSQAHQKISFELSRQFGNFLRGKPCEAFAAPFDVCLYGAGDDDSTVVQPDLLVVCDKSKLDGKRCNGAPDMVIEILSPSSGGRDRVLKFNKYLHAGVREYWIVDPENKFVLVHELVNGKYITSAFDESDIVPVYVLDGCHINMKDVFEDIFEDEQDQKLYIKETAQQYSAERRYTYSDYASWDDENRYELIDGVVYLMSASSRAHQKISGELFRQLANFLLDKSCEVYAAPFDVCLYGAGDDDSTVVQPDILVVCDKSKLDDKRCNGAPDMVIEILSPSSRRRDRVLKYNKYRHAGVREYWIVDPDNQSVSVHFLADGHYFTTVYTDIGDISVRVLDGCKINLQSVFDGIK